MTRAFSRAVAGLFALMLAPLAASADQPYIRHFNADSNPLKSPTVTKLCPQVYITSSTISMVFGVCNQKVTGVRWDYCVTNEAYPHPSNPQFDRHSSPVDLAGDGRLICPSMRPTFIGRGSIYGGPGANTENMPPGPWAQNNLCGDGFLDTFPPRATGYFYATCFSLSTKRWLESSMAVKDCPAQTFGVNNDGQLTCEAKGANVSQLSGGIKCYKISGPDPNSAPTLYVVLNGPGTTDMSCDDEIAGGTAFAISLGSFGQALLKEIASATAIGLTATVTFGTARTVDHLNRDLTSLSVK
jgi:hypothetical protein